MENNVKSKLMIAFKLISPILLILLLLAIHKYVFRYYQLWKYGYLLVLFGLLFSYIGIGFGISSIVKKLRYTEPCMGKIISISEHWDEDEKCTTYSPVVQYRVDSEDYTVTSGFSTSKRGIPEIGEYVNVFYMKGHPAASELEFDRKIAPDFELWFVVAGFIAIIVGVIGQDLLFSLIGSIF